MTCALGLTADRASKSRSSLAASFPRRRQSVREEEGRPSVFLFMTNNKAEGIVNVLPIFVKRREVKKMSAAYLARGKAESLAGKIEARRRSRMLAYEEIAVGVGRSIDWVRGLISRGTGIVTEDISRSLDTMLLKELTANARRQQKELEVALALQRAGASNSEHIAELEAFISRGKELLGQ
jgi:hypothetical protein